MREQSLPLRPELPDAGAPAPAGTVLREPLLVTSFDTQRVSRTGLVVTVLLHLLVVMIAWLQPDDDEGAPAVRRATDITYIVARQRPPDVPVTPPKPAVKPQPRPVATPRPPPRRPERVEMARLPDTITVPDEPRREPEPPKPAEIPKLEPQADMADMIAARRRQRQRDSGVQEQETEAQRGERRALENIAAANAAGRNVGISVEKSSFSYRIHSPFTGMVELRDFRPLKNRRSGLRQEEVALGQEPDIETAIIKTMVKMIRQEAGEQNFSWFSRRQRRDVILSPRVEDTAVLEKFLFRESFPEHARAR